MRAICLATLSVIAALLSACSGETSKPTATESVATPSASQLTPSSEESICSGEGFCAPSEQNCHEQCGLYCNMFGHWHGKVSVCDEGYGFCDCHSREDN